MKYYYLFVEIADLFANDDSFRFNANVAYALRHFENLAGTLGVDPQIIQDVPEPEYHFEGAHHLSFAKMTVGVCNARASHLKRLFESLVLLISFEIPDHYKLRYTVDIYP